jgi:hypothetical protein
MALLPLLARMLVDILDDGLGDIRIGANKKNPWGMRWKGKRGEGNGIS